jgi:peptidoglycan/xylan/chitin deacetylase (PgdA/CDA1 family)
VWPTEACVLGLHRVLSAADYGRVNSLDAIVMRDSTFSSLLAYLSERFQVVPLPALFESGKPTRRKTKPLCLITFDDGWRDNYSTALPLLKKFALPAVVFVATASIGKPDGFWVEQLIAASKDPTLRDRMRLRWQALKGREHDPFDLDTVIETLKRMPARERDPILSQLLPSADSGKSSHADGMLSWQEVAEMAQSGVEIGSHTVNHPLLPYEDDESLREELVVSKQIIENKIGRPVQAFAYPNGSWDERARKQTAEAGYQCAFTTGPGWFRSTGDLFAIPRVLLHEGNVTGSDGRFSAGAFEWTLASGG